VRRVLRRDAVVPAGGGPEFTVRVVDRDEQRRGGVQLELAVLGDLADDLALGSRQQAVVRLLGQHLFEEGRRAHPGDEQAEREHEHRHPGDLRPEGDAAPPGGQGIGHRVRATPSRP
jgi:hypothetical protein